MSVFIKLMIQITVIFFLLLVPSMTSTSLAHQRQCFLAAEDALREGRREEFKQLLSTLEDYPLYAYLVYEDLRQNLSLENEELILSLMAAYAETPLGIRFENLWLQHLAKNKQWIKLARDYKASTSTSVQCYYARSLMETGQYARAWDEAEKLWRHGYSRPNECDPVFDQWKKTEGFTAEIVWQRIELSITHGQISLARYLNRYLPPDDQYWLELWLAILSRPKKTLDFDWSTATHPMAEKILHQGMSGLIREDTLNALAHWQDLMATHDLKAFDTAPIEQEIGLYLCLRKHREALAYLNTLHGEKMTPTLRWWHIRAAIYKQDWQAVLAAWEHLSDPDRITPRWTYWHARALEELGHKSEAVLAYQRITGRQNYFSLLAADRLNLPYSLNHVPITAGDADIAALQQDPGIMRAMEFFYLDRMTDARREWHFAMAGKGVSENNAAALLAHRMGFHDRAIIAAAATGSYDDLIIRFPMSYRALIQKYARERDLDPSWLFALARQESMFIPDVRSPAGALGVMQIMPDTGRRIAARIGENFTNQHMLLVPETNIRFGTLYLKNRLDDLQGNPVLATAAYNAGIRRVNNWLPENTGLPADVWIETIPFFETRDYVEKIFTYKIIYQQLLGQVPDRLTAMMSNISGEPIIAAYTTP